MSTPAPSAAAAVAVKIPPFVPQDLTSWFLLCDAQFTISNVAVESTKASYIVASLPVDAVTRVSPWILKQPDPAKISYTDLRTELIRLYDLPPSIRARKLLSFPAEGMGDRDPERLSEELLLLSRRADGSQVDILAEIYLQTLPKPVRDQMADTSGFSLKQLGSRAQEIWLQTSARSFSNISTVEPLDDQLIRSEICAIRDRPTNGHRNYTRSPAMSGKRREPTFDARGYCFYHAQFGSAAKKCASGCTFPKNSSSGRQ